MFLKSCQLSSSVPPKPRVPQMHITGISRLSTFIQCKSELHSPLHFGATRCLPPEHFYHRPGLTHFCYEVMTFQCHRYTGAVGFYLNYPTEYGAPTGSSSCNRTCTKTHFESHCHISLAMFTNHMGTTNSQHLYIFTILALRSTRR